MFHGESRVADKFVVRLPDGMRERIAVLASTNHRSMNSEIIKRLEESMVGDNPESAAVDHEHLSKEEKAIVLTVRKLSAGKRKSLLNLLADDQ